MEKMIAHRSIKLVLNQKFNSTTDIEPFTHIFIQELYMLFIITDSENETIAL